MSELLMYCGAINSYHPAKYPDKIDLVKKQKHTSWYFFLCFEKNPLSIKQKKEFFTWEQVDFNTGRTYLYVGWTSSTPFSLSLFFLLGADTHLKKSALQQTMKLMGVDCGIFLETKLTEGMYTRWSSAVTMSDPPMRRASDNEGLASLGES